VTGTPAPYAMIEAPSGKGHLVRRGTLVGTNFGRVISIRAEQIIVREEYRSYTGTKIFNDVVFTITPPKLELDDES
jgi:Tfp pilus assembly protein PilP